MAPETLVFTTSDPHNGGDDILLDRSMVDAPIFLQVTSNADSFQGTGTAFLALNEAIAFHEQLGALILDAQIRAAVAEALAR